MQTHRLELSESIIGALLKQPENGMGYQIVKVFLKSGRILHKLKVLNSQILLIEHDEIITVNDIEKIELEGAK
jgi:hypothetical protein